MIRAAVFDDLPEMCDVINDSAVAYKGIIPADRWHDPYMPLDELIEQFIDGIDFLCFVSHNSIVGVMGIQDKGDVSLIRHAYVRTEHRKMGIGAKLLRHIVTNTNKPILIGTWKAASWAIAFYEKHTFRVVREGEAVSLLRRFWDIPERQMKTSVVLANALYWSGGLSQTVAKMG